MSFLYYSIFENNYDIEVKESCSLLDKNVNFNNKNKTEAEIENLTNGFRETNLVLQFI